ncbi:glyceraldehyde-3-phosphate dehydrogenase Gap [Methyloglobulus morosus KoM1]|uniref:Glyceraldehyde-3-phosphate dehydrogenase Gap n=1 Tax=Methyloglobulus morosus KoM1 TaxID=1116472 RepID=V5C0R5_9GAMM|nr:glyceraldehyde 3-phosphate dehydrogenase NAD-binding domain-containing protein [Methyloglobulus morosus]ESS72042.1 glyceraldehyde-3-phosphate dehydrogenase Gap [Methyloglobulus morosus KoM1]
MTKLRVGIIGLGRVGRGIIRADFDQAGGEKYNLCALCDVMPENQVTYLLANDSTYGKPPVSLDCENKFITFAGKKVPYVRGDRRRNILGHESFAELRDLELDVIIDSTGTANINDLRGLIEQKIAKKVLCTANIAGIDASIVYGVNHKQYDPLQHHVIAASTCTGNAMAPVAYILNKHIGIDYARIITIHPALSDQRVLDGFHFSVPQLGRTCAASIIPISTNVAKSTALVLPELEGKLDSISYRVPTTIVSAMDVTATLSRDTSLAECIELMENYAQNELKGIIDCEYDAWGHEKVSIDYLGSEYSAIILMKHLQVSNQRHMGLSIMHDNERAYCCRVLDVLGVLQDAWVQ